MQDWDDITREGLRALVEELRERVVALEEQVRCLEAENVALREQLEKERSKKQRPDWVKAARPIREKKGRKKRSQGYARRRERPTEVHLHAMESCEGCGRKLAGGWEHRRRQVIELPVTSVRVVDHVVVGRWCGVCGQRRIPVLDLSQEVVGEHRLGVRLMSLIASLHTEGRMPMRGIQALLKGVYGVAISVGEISAVLKTVAGRGREAYRQMQAGLRTSPVVHGDETGWREDGANGYVWSFSTPKVRYFEYRPSRSGQIVEEVLGKAYEGILVSDFYGGYNRHLGEHQRCWVHLLRDLHEVKEKHSEETSVGEWVEAVIGVYREAKAFRSESLPERQGQRRKCEQALQALAIPYVGSETPQRVLAERIERFLPELFTFVEDPEVPADNNAAERAIRPVVIARKVSGGTRSDKGSQTQMILLSLFGTWAAQGLDRLETCRQMLIGQWKYIPP